MEVASLLSVRGELGKGAPQAARGRRARALRIARAQGACCGTAGRCAAVSHQRAPRAAIISEHQHVPTTFLAISATYLASELISVLDVRLQIVST